MFGYTYHVIWIPTYREQVERLERGGVNTIGKEHFTTLFSPARYRAFTAKNIKAGFAASGLLPFNPDRVLNSMPKPVPDLTVPRVDEANNEPLPQDEVPQTPATPVSAEGLVSLQNLIIKQDAHTLEEISKRRLRRHLDKFAKAAHLSFAKGALQQHHIRLLLKINDEAKVRRSTKSLVLGKAKVMGYEELQAARAKRAETEAAKATTAKGKRGRKRTKATSGADAAEPKGKVARTGATLEPTISAAAHPRKTIVAEGGPASTPWRAPVARMY